MAEIYLCLIDCASIQRYVFGSNKLKSNYGASYIVEKKIYCEWIPEALKEIFSDEDINRIKAKFKQWCQSPKDLYVGEGSAMDKWEIGYIGGGNALLLFSVSSDAQNFVTTWTRKLLLEAPGVRPVTAIVKCDQSDVAVGIRQAFKELNKNKTLYIAETIIPRHGITAECKITGLSAEIFDAANESSKWLSAVAYTKSNDRILEEATAYLNDKYGGLVDPFGDEYVFGYKIDELGQLVGEENHVAIVHIDGNQIGERFKKCDTLYEKRQLSMQVSQATENALRRILQDLLVKMPLLKDKRNKNHLVLSRDPEGKEILPFRFIIGAGDDVTFVCDARLGLFLAESFMRAFAEQPIDLKLNQPNDTSKEKKARLAEIQAPLSSCAGIAIIKTKYPFYRGYQLADKLCSSAKKEGRPNNTSWLDFHFSHSGLSYRNLDELRARRHMVGANCLLWRPWKVGDPDHKKSFQAAKDAIKYFRTVDGKGWPNSKLNELFHSLVQGKERTKEFLTVASSRGLVLPDIPGVKHAASDGWVGNFTPYYDIIEMMDFYPPALMEENHA